VADCAINVLSLCTGGRGLDRAVELCLPGARTVCMVEREAFAVEIVASEYEAMGLACPPCWSDVRTFAGRPWRGVVDMLVAGIPCQPHSVDGKRLGAADERNLWPDTRRIIEECQPPFVFLENVGGAVAFFGEHVVSGLEGMGYRVEAGLFTAAEVGATHRRERLFVLGYAEGIPRRQGRAEHAGQCRASSVEQPGGDVDHTAGTRCLAARVGPEALPEGRECLLGAGCGDVADASRDNDGRRTPERRMEAGGEAEKDRGPETTNGPNDLRPFVADSERPRREGPDPAGRGGADGCPAEYGRESLPLFPPGPADFDTWRRTLGADPSLEPAIRGMADGLASRIDRLRMLGNGVVPLQAAYAFCALLARMR